MIYKISPRYSFTRSNRNINSKLIYRGMLTTPGIGKYSKNILHKPTGGFSFQKGERFKTLNLETPGPGQYDTNFGLMGETPQHSLNNTFSGPFYEKKQTKKNLKNNEKIKKSKLPSNTKKSLKSDFEFLNPSDKKPKDQIKKEIKINVPLTNENGKNIKKRMIIQTHSRFCDIEKIDENLYLINNEEANISLLLCHSLNDKDISIYTFNKGQVKLLEKKIKKDFPFVNIILLNDKCTNIKLSNYIIINFIDSPISEKSVKKYPKFASKLDSNKYYRKELLDMILEKYTRKILYLICNTNYLKSKKKGKNNDLTFVKIYKEIQVPTISRKIVSNEYDICFILDNTISMSSWINSLKNICVHIFEEIVNKYKEYIFSFSSVLYGDKPSCSTSENFKIDFTENSLQFKSELEKIDSQDGDDSAEDWVSGFKIALEELTWGNGTKLIFHFADAPQHGKIFNIDREGDNFLYDEDDIHGKNLIELINQCSMRNIKITGISINNVSSFDVFKNEYEKVKGPKYEIIKIYSYELEKENNNIDKKICEIIEKSIKENKSKNYLK